MQTGNVQRQKLSSRGTAEGLMFLAKRQDVQGRLLIDHPEIVYSVHTPFLQHLAVCGNCRRDPAWCCLHPSTSSAITSTASQRFPSPIGAGPFPYSRTSWNHAPGLSTSMSFFLLALVLWSYVVVNACRHPRVPVVGSCPGQSRMWKSGTK